MCRPGWPPGWAGATTQTSSDDYDKPAGSPDSGADQDGFSAKLARSIAAGDNAWPMASAAAPCTPA